MARLKDRICVVTGAAAGIGRETTLAFLREGATVHALDCNDAALAALAGSIRNCMSRGSM